MSASPSADPNWPGLHKERRAIVMMDVVESVHLMQHHEDDFIDRWRRFVKEVESDVLPQRQGRLVKSLGDGLLLEFGEARAAITAALDVQRRITGYNHGRDPDECIRLRVAAHVADVVIDERDVFGSGVNLAARLMTLAQPGGVVASVDLCDSILADIDCELEDLGECDLKGLDKPVRAYRVAPASPVPSPARPDETVHTMPLIAVLPFDVGRIDDDARVVAQIIGDDLIVGLSVSPYWRVVSRLTAQQFAGRPPTIEDVGRQLRATYAISGSCIVSGSSIRVRVELADVTQGCVVWSDSVAGQRSDLLAEHNPIALSIIDSVSVSIFKHELRRARTRPLPTLRSFSLLFAAIGLMHRLSRADFERSWEMLEHLAERHPRAPEPRVWAAKWHALKVTQGWSNDPARQTLKAHDSVQRALDEQADHSLGLAIDGLIAGFLQGDLQTAERRYREALAANPSESMAWLFMSALMAYNDRGDDAVDCARHALLLSPLDPMRYFYDSFAANALLAAGRYEESIAVGQRSIKANATHMPTFRSLAIAQVMAGQVDAARATVQRLLRLRPDYSLGQFRERYAGRHGRHARAYFDALQAAGLPE